MSSTIVQMQTELPSLECAELNRSSN